MCNITKPGIRLFKTQTWLRTIYRSSNIVGSKILEKGAWYVGDSMFHTAKWTAGHSAAKSSSAIIQLWAHLTGVPLDLRHQKGLSLIAGLIGEPKETDDFTKNLVSLTLSHVKVEVNLTKELPNVVEYERESGEVVEVLVDYPWLPPKCSHCQELGHIAKNCLLLPPPAKVNPPAPGKREEGSNQTSKKATSKWEKKSDNIPQATTKPIFAVATDLPHPFNFSETLSSPLKDFSPQPSLPNPAFPSSSVPIFHPSAPLVPSKSLPVIIALPASFSPSGEPYPHSPPSFKEKISLKRSRSHPTLNSFKPPGSSSPNPTKASSAIPVFVPLKNSFASLSTLINPSHGSSFQGEPSPPS